MRRNIAAEGRSARGRIRVGGIVDLEVVNHQSGRFQGVDHTLGAQTAGRLGKESPYHRAVAGFEVEVRYGLGTQRITRRIVLGTDITESVAGILLLRQRQLGVLAGYNDALADGVVDQRIEGFIARVAHHGDAVRFGRDHFAELLDHLLRIPIRPHIIHLGAQIRLGLPGAVVNVHRKHAALRAAREEYDALSGTPLGCGGCHFGTCGCRGTRTGA